MHGLARLLKTHADNGRIAWIGIRPARLEPVQSLDEAEVTESGLAGDHASEGRRALTLIQVEHLPVIAALAGRCEITPDLLRRNIGVAGINLAALRHSLLRLGESEIAITGPCPPCSRMERAIGTGGYNAMRGHGGWYAEVRKPGRIAVGDAAEPLGPAG